MERDTGRQGGKHLLCGDDSMTMLLLLASTGGFKMYWRSICALMVLGAAMVSAFIIPNPGKVEYDDLFLCFPWSALGTAIDECIHARFRQSTTW